MSSTKKKGSVLGAILLIAGCCIGAGMLGLPVVTGVAGFVPALVIFIGSWLFMCSTALLLLEANLWFTSKDSSLITMADKTLGKAGSAVAWGCFLFLFYALGVAYLGASGQLVTDFTSLVFKFHVPNEIGSIAIAFLFGISIYFGTGTTDVFNRFLMGGLVIMYFLLIILGAPHVNSHLLTYHDLSAALYVVPILIISFGFHNMIPSLTIYLGGNRKRLIKSILLGSAIPLFIYVIWEWLILGIIPVEGEHGIRHALSQGDMATEALKAAAGSSIVVDIANGFAFFAIVTSLLGNSLSFVDFLADGLGIPKKGLGKLALCTLVMLPPLLFTLWYPHIFLVALSYAGAFGALTLFGILPAAMVWSGRYRKGLEGTRLLPGGKGSLLLIMGLSLAVIALQVYNELSKLG